MGTPRAEVFMAARAIPTTETLPDTMWLCAFCYLPCFGSLPKDWDLVWGHAVCPACQKRVAADGGYGRVRGGAYSHGAAPRKVVQLERRIEALEQKERSQQ